jgi:hypothetical protein
MTSSKVLFDAKSAAVQVGCSSRHVARLVARRKLRGIRIRGKLFVFAADLRTFLNAPRLAPRKA